MTGRYVLLSGGVGGAKLAEGLASLLPANELTVIGNVGDDFEHLGLHISPDLDTLLYTLCGEVNRSTGWGRREESWNFLSALEQLGGETWFRLGDRDLATHLLRSQALHQGASLTEATQQLCRQLGLGVELLPVSDAAVRTRVDTDAGELGFQDYFVRRRAEPKTRALHYVGAETATISPQVQAALADPGLQAIIIAPSNPWLSIAPMLALDSLVTALRASTAPIIAVSPIVAGQAIKGPTAKIMQELGLQVTALSVARHYRELLDGFILDQQDAALTEQVLELGMAVESCDTLMTTLAKKTAVADACLNFALRLRQRRA